MDLEKENEVLRKRVKELEEQIAQLKANSNNSEKEGKDGVFTENFPYFENSDSPLNAEQIKRYGRHLIMSEIGVKGQRKLCNSSVLIVGGGGLGSPSAFYLAGAGIGRIGVVDYDSVEISNLQRQIIHNENSVGVPKSLSAKKTLKMYNSSVEVFAYNVIITSKNALDIIKPYDVVLDCTDNVATRYLLNDACVLLKKPLVSGAALRMEGQLTVYNHDGGPCYRCIFPKPPPPETVTDCSNGGVLGVVPGIIGCMQALEAIKIIAGVGNTMSQRMLLFNALEPRYQMIKMRNKKEDCAVCGKNPTITQLIDYELFCGAKATDKPSTKSIVDPSYSITCMQYKSIRDSKSEHVLLDVRSKIQYEICSLENSIIAELPNRINEVKEKISNGESEKELYVICRRGNDSQHAVKLLLSQNFQPKNILGGLSGWSKEVDNSFPV